MIVKQQNEEKSISLCQKQKGKIIQQTVKNDKIDDNDRSYKKDKSQKSSQQQELLQFKGQINKYQNQHIFSQFTDLFVYLKEIIISENVKMTDQIKNMNLIIESEQQSLIDRLQLLKYSKKYHQNQLQTIQKQILKDGIFKKCSNFVTQLIIHSSHSSVNYQIVKLQVQLLNYKTNILILNQVQQSHLHNLTDPCCSGAFGKVYFVKLNNQQYAIKCITLDRSLADQNKLIDKIIQIKWILTEYFLNLLFDKLKIAPKVKKMAGFDMIISQNCIQFSSQLCLIPNLSSVQSQNSLKQCIRIMHILKITHRDIKPSNIMFSQAYQKVILIDFGNCKIINQPICLKSITGFAGTSGYCSQQMVNLIRKQKKYVDLYFNDCYGFIKSIVTKSITNNNIEYSNLSNMIQQISNQNDIYNVDSYKIFLNRIKYYFYIKSQNDIMIQWRSLKINFFQVLEQIEIQIVNFFMDLIPYSFIKDFYKKQISWNIKSLSKYKLVEKHLNWPQRSKVSFHKISKEKSLLFQKQRRLYQFMSQTQKENNIKLKWLYFILISKQQINSYLLGYTLTNDTQYIKDNFIVYSIAMIKLCSLNQNRYKTCIDEKILLCQEFIQIVRMHYKQQEQSLKLVFKCQIEKLQPLAQLFQFFIIQLWHKIQFSIKNPLVNVLIATLCLLGYPYYIIQAKQYLISYFISGPQSKVQQIQWFWRCNLAIINSDIIGYSRKSNNFHLKLTSQQKCILDKRQKELMQNLDQLNNKITYQSINKYLYEHIYLTNNQARVYQIVTSLINQYQSQKVADTNYVNYQVGDAINITQAYDTININNFNFQAQKTIKIKNPKLQEYVAIGINDISLQQEFINIHDFKRWKQIINFLLQILQFRYEISQAMKIACQIPQSTSNIFQLHQVWTYRMQLSYRHLNFQECQSILELIDQSINYQPISSRFFIHYRISLAIHQQNINLLQKYIKKIEKQCKFIEFQQINCFNKIISSIDKIFKINYFKLSSNKSLFYLILLKLQPLFQKFVQTIVFFLQNFISSPNNIISDSLLHLYLEQIISIAITIQQIYKISDKLATNQQKFKKDDINDINSKIDNIQNQRYRTTKRLLVLFQKIMHQSSFQLIKQNIVIKNGLFIFFISSNDKQQHEQVYKFIFDDIGKYDLQNYQSLTMPSLVIFHFYYVSLFISQNFSQSASLKLVQLSIQLIKRTFYSILLLKQNIILFFYAHFNAKVDFALIQQYLLVLTYEIKNNPFEFYIQSFHQAMNQQFKMKQSQFIIDQCPNKQPKQQFIIYLSINIQSINPINDSYMSLIYLYCLSYQRLNIVCRRKFLRFIFKSIPYLSTYTARLILQQIYGHTTNVLESVKQFINLNKSKCKNNYHQKKIKSFVQIMQNQYIKTKSIHKQFYFWLKYLRNQNKNMLLTQIINKIYMFKQIFNHKWNLPLQIDKLYRKKLTKYQLIKENYKKL